LYAAGVEKEVIMDNPTQEVDITEVITSLKQNSDSTAKLCETISMGFDEIKKTWVPKLAEVAPKPDAAKLEESRIASMKVAGVQVLPFAIGAFSAVFVSELIDGVMVTQSKVTKGLVKGVGAFAAYKWGRKIPFVGDNGAKIIALLLAFDAVRDLTPIDAYAAKLANKVSGVIPIGGLADQRGRDVRDQANKVVKDYYANAMGR
jgi:hypothetical protein